LASLELQRRRRLLQCPILSAGGVLLHIMLFLTSRSQRLSIFHSSYFTQSNVASWAMTYATQMPADSIADGRNGHCDRQVPTGSSACPHHGILLRGAPPTHVRKHGQAVRYDVTDARDKPSPTDRDTVPRLQCCVATRAIAFNEPPQADAIEKILRHCELWQPPRSHLTHQFSWFRLKAVGQSNFLSLGREARGGL
jgi:hypothetical protein